MKELAGKLVLIAEDESLIALDLASALADAGALVLGPFADADTAMSAVALQSPAAAIIDWQLLGESARTLAAVLIAKGVPFVLHSGCAVDQREIGKPADVMILPKPAPATDIIEQLGRLLRGECPD